MNVFAHDISLTVVLPAYNEEEIISQTVQSVLNYLRGRLTDFEIIVVNDGSHDRTEDIVKKMMATCPEIGLITHQTNQGYGQALHSGFNAVKKDWILLMDSDGQFNIATLDQFLPYTSDYSFIVGWRDKRKDPPLRIMLTGGYNTLVTWLLGIKFDFGCAFKLFRRDTWLRLQPIRSHDPKIFSVELLAKAVAAKEHIKQLPVQHHQRQGGTPTGGQLKTILPLILNLFRLWIGNAHSALDSPARQVVGMILSVKVCLFIFSIIAFSFLSGTTAATTVPQFMSDAWYRWDALNYLKIAQHGYVTYGDERNLIAFFPLFPALLIIDHWCLLGCSDFALVHRQFTGWAGRCYKSNWCHFITSFSG